MNLQDYINSGLLEQYCLGLLDSDEANQVVSYCSKYPELREELKNIEAAIEKMSAEKAVAPPDQLKEKILGKLGFVGNEVLDINNLPPTDAYSNYLNWLQAVEHLLPTEPFEGLNIQILQQTDKIAQMLVVAKVDVPDESHDNYAESFFILQGKCSCTINGKQVILNAGDYLEIPLYADHDVKMLTPVVTAILQYRFV
nr:cupin domain-containing protein [uncultured Mucilaginibacter sp.]